MAAIKGAFGHKGVHRHSDGVHTIKPLRIPVGIDIIVFRLVHFHFPQSGLITSHAGFFAAGFSDFSFLDTRMHSKIFHFSFTRSRSHPLPGGCVNAIAGSVFVHGFIF
jgi:hypothetical protein